MKKEISVALLSGFLVFSEKTIFSQETQNSNLYFSSGKETLSAYQKILLQKEARFQESNLDSVRLFVNQAVSITTIDGLEFSANLSGLALQDGDILTSETEGLCKIETLGATVWLAENSSVQMKIRKDQISFVLLRGTLKLVAQEYAGTTEITVETSDIFSTNKANDLVMSYLPHKGTTFYSILKPNQIFLKSDLMKTFSLRYKESLSIYKNDIKRKIYDARIERQVAKLFAETSFVLSSDYTDKIGEYLTKTRFVPAKDYKKNESQIFEALENSYLKETFDIAEISHLAKNYLRSVSKTTDTTETFEDDQQITDKNQAHALNKKLYYEKIKEAESLRLKEKEFRRKALEAELRAKSLE